MPEHRGKYSKCHSGGGSCIQHITPQAVRYRSTGKMFEQLQRWRLPSGVAGRCASWRRPEGPAGRRLDRGATREPRGPRTRANHWAGNRGVVETICESYLVTAMDCRNCWRLKAKKARPMAATAKNWGQTVSNPAPRKMMACENATK